MRLTEIGRHTLIVGLLLTLMLAACGEPTPDAQPSEVPPEPAGGHFEQGNELSQAGEFEKAADEYVQALEVEPDNVDALTNLGVAYYNLGELDKAIEQYTRAIELAPEDADIRSNLAAAYVQEHQSAGSSDALNMGLEEYERAVELDPDLPEAHFGLGVVYALLGRTSDAIQAIERFQELDTGSDPLATQNAAEYLKQLRGQ